MHERMFDVEILGIVEYRQGLLGDDCCCRLGGSGRVRLTIEFESFHGLRWRCRRSDLRHSYGCVEMYGYRKVQNGRKEVAISKAMK